MVVKREARVKRAKSCMVIGDVFLVDLGDLGSGECRTGRGEYYKVEVKFVAPGECSGVMSRLLVKKR